MLLDHPATRGIFSARNARNHGGHSCTFTTVFQSLRKIILLYIVTIFALCVHSKYRKAERVLLLNINDMSYDLNVTTTKARCIGTARFRGSRSRCSNLYSLANSLIQIFCIPSLPTVSLVRGKASSTEHGIFASPDEYGWLAIVWKLPRPPPFTRN
jgi:hypothetical protein